jgi:hypothetical protein
MATYTDDGSVPNPQTKINSAATGDTVIIRNGHDTWTSQLVISKGITLQGASTGGVTLTSGNYLLSGLVIGTYSVTPSKSGYTFSSANRSVTADGPNVTGIDFGGSPASAGITAVQGNSDFTNSSGSRLSYTLTGAQTVGNTNIVVICTGTTSGTISSLADTKGYSYTLVGQATGTSIGQWIYSAVINSGGTGNAVTVTLTGPVNGMGIAVSEYSGIMTSSPIDGTPQSAANHGTNATTAHLTTTNAKNLIFAAATGDSNKQFSAGAAYTMRAAFGDWPCTAVEDQITSPAGSFAGSFTN